MERDPAMLKADVLNEFVSLERAADLNGVVIDRKNNKMETDGTVRLCQSMKSMQTYKSLL